MAITDIESLKEKLQDPLYRFELVADQVVAIKAMFEYIENNPDVPVPIEYFYKAGMVTPSEKVYRRKQNKRNSKIAVVKKSTNTVASSSTDKETQEKVFIKSTFSTFGICPEDSDSVVRAKVIKFLKNKDAAESAWKNKQKDKTTITIVSLFKQWFGLN